MRTILSTLLLFVLQVNFVLAQNKIDFGIYPSSSLNQMEIRIKPNYAESGAQYLTNSQFAVKWPVSSGITSITAGSPISPYSLSSQGSPWTYNGYYYQVFASSGGNLVSWTANQEIVVQTFTYSYAGIANPQFEIAHDSYSINQINGDYYIEVNGKDMSGSLYNAFAAIPFYWNGSQSTQWDVAANWSPAVIPGLTSDVIIPAAGTTPYSPVLTSLAEIKNLRISLNGKLTIANIGKLTVMNNLVNNADSGLVLKSDANGNASLITMGNVSGSGNAKVEQYLLQGSGVRYHYISSPISNALCSVYTGYLMYAFNEPTNAWTNMSSNQSMDVMKGYIVYKPGMSTDTKIFSGSLNYGSMGSANNVTRASDTTGWNLIGNPYASAIDWRATYGWTKTNIANSIYTYNQATKLYASYIDDDGGSTNGGSRYIPAMQGFMVRVADGNIIGTIRMNDSVRVHNTQAFWKNNLQNVLRLTVSNDDVSDETVVRFKSESSTQNDLNWDAHKMMSNEADAQLYSTLKGEDLSITTLPEIHNNLTVPLSLKIKQSGLYQITATELGSFDAGTYLYLEDLQLHVITNLRESPTYSLNGTSEDNPARFKLHFCLSPLNMQIGIAFNSEVYSFDKTLYVNINSANTTGRIEVYDVLGKLYFTSQLQSNTLNTFNLKALTSGCYLVRVYNNDEVISRKVMVK
ncbi:MAG: T9SS type A sorting domain-containing protein [Bacteroidota bacterium]